MLRAMCAVFAVMGLCTGCASSGRIGPTGYTQDQARYEVRFSDPAKHRFLSEDWQLDNYSYDASKDSWSEKTGDQYRVTRYLDEDGDGSIGLSETHGENLFDLRFVNSRDNSVIWLKLHPVSFANSKRDLEVVLEQYVDGLEGTGLFEQSTLFGTDAIKARHFTTFVVDKSPAKVGALFAIRGTIEVADVEKLRVEPNHRDTKGVLLFARVAYLERAGTNPKQGTWPVVYDPKDSSPSYKRTGLLVIGYWSDATRFESHRPDFDALLSRIAIPALAVPDDNAPVVIKASSPSAVATSAPASPAPPVALPNAAAGSASPPPTAEPAPSAPVALPPSK